MLHLPLLLIQFKAQGRVFGFEGDETLSEPTDLLEEGIGRNVLEPARTSC
jgi:hypothetical protein